MLVGEAPGREEDELGKTFVGAAGRLLDEVLEEVGIDRRTVYVTNPLKCRPPGNRDPEASELAACWPYLAEELMQVRPKVIVALGRFALQSLTGRKVIKDERGKPVPPAKNVRVGDAKIIATYHPAAYFNGGRKPSILAAIKEDFELAYRLSGRSTDKLPLHQRTLVFPDTSKDVALAALWGLEDDKLIAVDCEWTAGKYDDDNTHWPWTPDSELYSVSVSGLINGVVKSVAIAWPPAAGIRDAFLDFLTRHHLVFHNAMADLIWLWSVGFKSKAHDDTQFFAYLLNEEQRLNLDRLAALIVGIPEWKHGVWTRRPTSRSGWTDLLEYNSDDTYATRLLLDGLKRLVRTKSIEEQKNIAKAYYKLLLPAIPAFVSMALNGVPVSSKALLTAIDEQSAIEDEQISKTVELTGFTRRQAQQVISSPDKIRIYLKESYGLDLPNARAETLEPFAMHYPIVQTRVAYTHARKLKSTYVEPWHRLITRQGDNRLHSVYRLDRTRTGRTTASVEEGGSIQLAPREQWLRRAIRSLDKKWSLISADYSQAELRMIAWLAPERRMRQLYAEGADLHKVTAAFMKAHRDQHLTINRFWPERDKWVASVTGEERQRAKGINFGFDFGMQEEKFVLYAYKNYNAVFSLEEAHDAREGYFALYEDLQDWHDRCADDLSRGWVVTPFGRYRRGITDVTQMINTPIQTTANDLAIFATSYISDQVEDKYSGVAKMVGYIHDSVIIEVRDDYAEEIKLLTKQSMEHPPLDRVGIEIPVPLIADVKIGRNWADAS